jgi:hypothetical protein
MRRAAANTVAIFGLLMAMSTTAEAKRTPFTPAPAARTPETWTIFMGPAGAMLESDYFRAPHDLFKRSNAGACRLYRHGAGDTLRLAYSCR